MLYYWLVLPQLGIWIAAITFRSSEDENLRIICEQQSASYNMFCVQWSLGENLHSRSWNWLYFQALPNSKGEKNRVTGSLEAAEERACKSSCTRKDSTIQKQEEHPYKLSGFSNERSTNSVSGKRCRHDGHTKLRLIKPPRCAPG